MEEKAENSPTEEGKGKRGREVLSTAVYCAFWCLLGESAVLIAGAWLSHLVWRMCMHGSVAPKIPPSD